MEKEFVPYELAVKLKSFGFKETCFGRWFFRADFHRLNEEEFRTITSNYFDLPEHYTLAPTFSQAFRWFRENYNIQSSVKFSGSKNHYAFEIRFQKLANGENPPIMVWHHLDSWLGLNLDLFSTYEEAELACLTMLIEIVESKSE